MILGYCLHRRGLYSQRNLNMTFPFIPRHETIENEIVPQKAAYDLAWLDQHGRPNWDTRTLPVSKITEMACASIARGGLVLTQNGPVAVDDLIPGDMVQTVTGGGDKEIQWIGSRTYCEDIHTQTRAPLYRIVMDAFGEGYPKTDTILANSAYVYVEHAACRRIIGSLGAFAPIAAFEDGINVTKITPQGDITVYNMAFNCQAVIQVNGLNVESFHPNRDTMQLINPESSQALLALMPHLRSGMGFGPQVAPRLSFTETKMLIHSDGV